MQIDRIIKLIARLIQIALIVWIVGTLVCYLRVDGVSLVLDTFCAMMGLQLLILSVTTIISKKKEIANELFELILSIGLLISFLIAILVKDSSWASIITAVCLVVTIIIEAISIKFI